MIKRFLVEYFLFGQKFGKIAYFNTLSPSLFLTSLGASDVIKQGTEHKWQEPNANN